MFIENELSAECANNMIYSNIYNIWTRALYRWPAYFVHLFIIPWCRLQELSWCCFLSPTPDASVVYLSYIHRLSHHTHDHIWQHVITFRHHPSTYITWLTETPCHCRELDALYYDICFRFECFNYFNRLINPVNFPTVQHMTIQTSPYWNSHRYHIWGDIASRKQNMNRRLVIMSI